MILNFLKFILVVALPLGIISAVFNHYFENWLAKKYPSMSSTRQDKIGLAAMLGMASVLTIAFFIVLHLTT